MQKQNEKDFLMTLKDFFGKEFYILDKVNKIYYICRINEEVDLEVCDLRCGKWIVTNSLIDKVAEKPNEYDFGYGIDLRGTKEWSTFVEGEIDKSFSKVLIEKAKIQQKLENKIQEWMKDNRIDFDNKFIIYGTINNTLYHCRIDKNYKFECFDFLNNIWVNRIGFIEIVIDNPKNYKIFNKEIYVPDGNTPFYYIDAELNISFCSVIDTLDDIGKQLRKILIGMGNCYFSKKEAEAYKEYWKQQFYIFNSDVWTIGDRVHCIYDAGPEFRTGLNNSSNF